MDILAKVHWSIYMTVSMVLISTTQFAIRKYGLCWGAYAYYSSVAVFLTGWMLPMAYQNASSLFQPWFLSIALLSIFGFGGSVLFFQESITVYQIIGAVLSLIGAGFLAIK